MKHVKRVPSDSTKLATGSLQTGLWFSLQLYLAIFQPRAFFVWILCRRQIKTNTANDDGIEWMKDTNWIWFRYSFRLHDHRLNIFHIHTHTVDVLFVIWEKGKDYRSGSSALTRTIFSFAQAKLIHTNIRHIHVHKYDYLYTGLRLDKQHIYLLIAKPSAAQLMKTKFIWCWCSFHFFFCICNWNNKQNWF